MNQFIRCCVERREIPKPIPEVNRLTAVELGHIELNLNQLAQGDEYSDRLSCRIAEGISPLNWQGNLTFAKAQFTQSSACN
ncbi:MAG TPA: hypothetical protein V6C95_21040 [Coleofasciculaceae cyanobacterium]